MQNLLGDRECSFGFLYMLGCKVSPDPLCIPGTKVPHANSNIFYISLRAVWPGGNYKPGLEEGLANK